MSDSCFITEMGKAEKMNCDTLFNALHMPENPPPDWCKDNPWLV